MITLDGAAGEGGGQVLRSALSLSLVTGQPFTIERIRANRKKPGLQRQHLTAVQAAAEIGSASTSGAELGSSRLVFAPKRVRGGDYRFVIGTAGSTTLVLQTILLPLLLAAEPSAVMLGGGTHNPLAPSFDFLALTFVPLLRTMGASLELHLLRHGFAPAGGGMLALNVSPSRLAPLQLLQRGAANLRRARALVARLPRDIAQRELVAIRQRVGLLPDELYVETVDADGPGNMLVLELPYQHVTEVVGIAGERGLGAVQVAARAAAVARAYLATDAPVGRYLADQLLLPLALAGGGAFRTGEPSLHTRTNADVIERFLPVHTTFTAEPGGTWRVDVTAR